MTHDERLARFKQEQSDDTRTLQRALSEARRESNELRQQLASAQRLISNLQGTKESMGAKVRSLDHRNYVLSANLNVEEGLCLRWRRRAEAWKETARHYRALFKA